MIRRRTLIAALAFAAAAAVALPGTATPARADDDPLVIDLNGGNSTIPVTLSGLGDFIIPGGQIPLTPAAGCTPVGSSSNPAPVGGTLCIGAPLGGEAPLEVVGLPQRGLVAGGGEAAAAIGWIVEEAREAVRALYDVPLDARVQRYAAPEIRAYVVNRIVDIMDRYAYGHTLTAQESATLTFVQTTVLTVDREVTTAAYEEYQRWQSQGCGYVPPAAPAFVADPVGLPDDVRRWCLRAQNFYDQIFVFAPPQPSAEHFQAWGAYRNAAALGLSNLDEAEAQRMLAQTVTAGAVTGGVATAIGAAVATSVLVGSSSALAGAVAGAMGASAATGAAMTAFGESTVAIMMSGTAAGAAASVVAIVILAVVVTAIAIWQMIEYAKVGETITARMNQAASAEDPFGLEPLRALGADRPLREGLTATNLPAYRNEANSVRIAQLVTNWMTISPQGELVPDAEGVWADNATTARDFRFQVDDGGGPLLVDSLSVPDGAGGFQQVRFNRSWMIVTPADGAPKAALSFRFRDADGVDTFAARSVGAQGGWVLTRAASGGGFVGTPSAVIRYRDGGGALVTARIVPPEKVLGGPYPTVVGPLVPGRVVNLRPNPIAADGSFDLTRYQNDYAYEWQLSRFDPDSGVWTPLANATPNEYGTRFTPTAVGEYRAIVTMTDLIDPNAAPVSGAVQFRVNTPTIVADTAVLNDDGVDTLRLGLRLSETVPTDEFTVAVQWPGEIGGGSGPVTTRTLSCSTLGVTCETALLPIEFTQTLSPTSDLSAGVTVTVRNSYGGVLTRSFAIDHPARPTLAAPSVPPTAAQLGTVQFGTGSLSAQLVAEVGENTNYQLAEVNPGQSQLPASFGFMRAGGQSPASIDLFDGSSLALRVSRDPATDRWAIGLWGVPRLADIGSYEFPLTLVQNNGAVTSFMLRLQIVPSPGDRYRGVLVNSIDPADIGVSTLPTLQPQIIGGQTGWDEYPGEICVTLRDTGLPDAAEEKCGAASEFIDATGAPLPFPYKTLMPAGVPRGTLSASMRLADGGASATRAYAGTHEVRFALESGPPSITALAWNAEAQAAMLTIAPYSTAAPITAIRCELDGVPTACWDTSAGRWSPSGLAAGPHTLSVWADDAAGNYTSRTLAFVASAQSSGPGTNQPGTNQPGTNQPGTRAPSAGTPAPGGAASPPAASDAGSVEDGGTQGVEGSGDGPRAEALPGSPGDDTASSAATGAGQGTVWLILGLLLVLLVGAAVGVSLLRRRRGA